MDKLNIPSNYTFGVEIEYVGIKYEEMKRKIEKLKRISLINKEWQITTDITVPSGAEIKSYVMKNEKEDLLELKHMCKLIKSMKGFTNSSCAGHIHIGNQAYELNPRNLQNLILLWLQYQDIIFRYSKGNDNDLRPCITYRAKPLFCDCYHSKLNEIFLNKETDYNGLVARIVKEIDRNYSVNFLNLTRMRIDTTEFRIPNGTIDYNIWFNNVTFFSNLIEYAKRMSNEERLYIFNEIKNYNNVENYLTINKVKALELVNKIYKVSDDKKKFMKQYLK